MNRAVWVVALNAIMQTAAGNGTFGFADGAFDKLSPPIYEREARLENVVRSLHQPLDSSQIVCIRTGLQNSKGKCTN